MLSLLSLLLVYYTNVVGQVFKEDDLADFDPPPGAAPIPDDQGNLEVCTRFAISKAVVDGFMKKKFIWGKEIDIDQRQVVMTLINEHKDGDGKWPHEFNHKRYIFQDSNNKYWETKLFVQKLPSEKDFINDVTSHFQVNTYVLVYPLNRNYPNEEKHCVYAEDYDQKSDEVLCINSDPKDPWPRIPVHGLGNNFYKVWCTASEMSNGSVSSPTISSPSHPVSSPSCLLTYKPPRKDSGTQTQIPPLYTSVPVRRRPNLSTDTLQRRSRHSSGRRDSQSSQAKRLSDLLSSPHDTIPRASMSGSKSIPNLYTINDFSENSERYPLMLAEQQYHEANPKSLNYAQNITKRPDSGYQSVSNRGGMTRSATQPTLDQYSSGAAANSPRCLDSSFNDAFGGEGGGTNTLKKKKNKFGSIRNFKKFFTPKTTK